MKKNFLILIICLFVLAGCKNNEENAKKINISRISNEYKPVETLLGSYTSPIYDKTPSRVNNIKIACDTLNGTIVKPRRNFFF